MSYKKGRRTEYTVLERLRKAGIEAERVILSGRGAVSRITKREEHCDIITKNPVKRIEVKRRDTRGIGINLDTDFIKRLVGREIDYVVLSMRGRKFVLMRFDEWLNYLNMLRGGKYG